MFLNRSMALMVPRTYRALENSMKARVTRTFDLKSASTDAAVEPAHRQLKTLIKHSED